MESQMDIAEELRRRVAEVGTQKILADQLGVSQPFLCQVINGQREPGPVLLDALGIEKVVTYRPKAKANA